MGARARASWTVAPLRTAMRLKRMWPTTRSCSVATKLSSGLKAGDRRNASTSRASAGWPKTSSTSLKTCEWSSGLLRSDRQHAVCPISRSPCRPGSPCCPWSFRACRGAAPSPRPALSGCRTLRRIQTRLSSSGVQQQLLLARAGLVDVDGGEDAAVGELAVEHDLRVAGALELLEDHLVHARAGVDERGAR